jgi:hypothetical protein
MISGYAPADPNRAARLPASAAATWLRTDYGWLINTLPNLNKMQSTRHNMYIYILSYLHAYCLCEIFLADVSCLTPFVGQLPILECLWFNQH